MEFLYVLPTLLAFLLDSLVQVHNTMGRPWARLPSLFFIVLTFPAKFVGLGRQGYGDNGC